MTLGRFRQAAFAALILLAFGVLPGGHAEAQAPLSPREAAAITINLQDLLANEPGLPFPVRQRRDALYAYYQEEAGPLLFIGTDRMTDFVARLAEADEDGLDPAAYPSAQLAELVSALPDTDIRGKAIIELHFAAAFLEYASDLQVGRFLPRKVDPNFYLQDKAIDPLAAFNGLRDAKSLTQFFAAWQPQGPDYAALKETLAKHRAIAHMGGWSTVALGETLKPAMSDQRVPDLRARLAVTDGVDPNAPAGAELVYDDTLVKAVHAFQKRHGLDADGNVGKATIVALNVPVEARIEEIVVAMERWRWMPDDLGDRHVLVNIAGFDLKLVRDGEVEDEMAVVVGKPYSRTPAFSDAIRYLEFNPYWNVPAGIAVKEELPRLRKNPGALAASGFEAVQGEKAYSVNAINWSRYGPGNFPFQLRQKPGPRNALGQVKFMFPNQFNVYLHDTPARTLFVKSDRAFSHGCIRLSRPLDLAQEVLVDTPGWDRQRIDGVLDKGDRTVVNLSSPLPIHITYLTAWVDDGETNFRNDVYKQDEKLVAALAGRTLAW